MYCAFYEVVIHSGRRLVGGRTQDGSLDAEDAQIPMEKSKMDTSSLPWLANLIYLPLIQSANLNAKRK